MSARKDARCLATTVSQLAIVVSAPDSTTTTYPTDPSNYLSLSHQLALLLHGTSTQKELLYRLNHIEHDEYDVIFSGSHCSAMVNNSTPFRKRVLAIEPLLNELQDSSKHGMNVDCDDGKERHSKVHLLIATGDIPGVATPCWSYFNLWLSHLPPFDVYMVPMDMWPSETFFEGSLKVGKGAISKTPLFSLPSFDAPTIFAIDEMHLIGHGLANQLIDMLEHYKGEDRYQQRSLPWPNSSSFRKPFGQNTTRAVDWVDIARSVIPALFTSKFKDPETKTAVISIVDFSNSHYNPQSLPHRSQE
ncbi:hypothetical protein [Absidia glauca]|uniref:Uncharacterized protein n=1 Tax=Absidia glauca TaxID=4829 RepID=A0A168PUN0_ABSGL|nr:hypothetical protein [Absidia glauca]